MGSFPCRDSSDYGWEQNVKYFHARILGDHSYHVGATWLQQTSPLDSSTLRVHLSPCLSFQVMSPSTSSLVGRIIRPSLLATLSLMIASVNWICMLWDLSLSAAPSLHRSVAWYSSRTRGVTASSSSRDLCFD